MDRYGHTPVAIATHLLSYQITQLAEALPVHFLTHSRRQRRIEWSGGGDERPRFTRTVHHAAKPACARL